MRDENRIINVEVQTGHKKELPKRSRYYQSVADVSTTATGTKYRDLPENILIFICTFDPFNSNYPRYTFQYSCDEAPQLKLKDGSLRIFLNTKATELSALDQKLQAFYHFTGIPSLPGFLGAGAVSQRLNRDSLKSLNISRFSG